MIHEDLKLLCHAFKEVVPLIQCTHDGQHFLVVDQLPIEVHKAKEGLDLLYLHWSRPFHDSMDLCWIHGDVVFQDDQSKVLNLLSLKLAFLWLEEQPPLSEGSKDLADDLPVFREGTG